MASCARATRRSFLGGPKKDVFQFGTSSGRPRREHAEHVPVQEPPWRARAPTRRPSTVRASSRPSRSAVASMHNCMTGCIVQVLEHRPRRRGQLQDERPRVRDADPARRQLRHRELGGRRRPRPPLRRDRPRYDRDGRGDRGPTWTPGDMEFGDAEGMRSALLRRDRRGHRARQGDRQRRRGDRQAPRSHGRVPTVAKGQAIPAWDPRPLKATGVTYCTSPMGADHTAGLIVNPGLPPDEFALGLARRSSSSTPCATRSGFCQFLQPNMDEIRDFYGALYGEEVSRETIARPGLAVPRGRVGVQQAGRLDRRRRRAWPSCMKTRTAVGPESANVVFDVAADVIQAAYKRFPAQRGALHGEGHGLIPAGAPGARLERQATNRGWTTGTGRGRLASLPVLSFLPFVEQVVRTRRRSEGRCVTSACAGSPSEPTWRRSRRGFAREATRGSGPTEPTPLARVRVGACSAESIVARRGRRPWLPARSAMDGYAVRGEDTFGASRVRPRLRLAILGHLAARATPSTDVVEPGRGGAHHDGRAGAGRRGRRRDGRGVQRARRAPAPRCASRCATPSRRRKNVGAVGRGRALRGAPRCSRMAGGSGRRTPALLASVGRRPRSPCRAHGRACSLVITGDELLPAGKSAPTHRDIVDSNSLVLRRARRARRRRSSCPAHHPARRARSVIAEAPGRTPRRTSLLVSGGSSVGQEDHAPRLLAERGEPRLPRRVDAPLEPGWRRAPARGGHCRRCGSCSCCREIPVSCLCAYEFFAGPTCSARLGGRSRRVAAPPRASFRSRARSRRPSAAPTTCASRIEAGHRRADRDLGRVDPLVDGARRRRFVIVPRAPRGHGGGVRRSRCCSTTTSPRRPSETPGREAAAVPRGARPRRGGAPLALRAGRRGARPGR